MDQQQFPPSHQDTGQDLGSVSRTRLWNRQNFWIQLKETRMKDVPKKYLFCQQFIFLWPSEELLLYVNGPQSRRRSRTPALSFYSNLLFCDCFYMSFLVTLLFILAVVILLPFRSFICCYPFITLYFCTISHALAAFFFHLHLLYVSHVNFTDFSCFLEYTALPLKISGIIIITVLSFTGLL